MAVVPFKIEVPEAAIVDLNARLSRARWPDEIPGSGWDYGVDLGYMKELIGYWRDGFDWRAQERRLNAFPQFIAEVDGLAIHFIHVRGKGPAPRPLILTHGWPSSVAEFTKIIPLLSDPGAHGGDPADAFDVIVPSMPGYGFSARPQERGVTSLAVAHLWAKLMSEHLGYARFFAQGGDIGAGVTNWLGRLYGDRVAATHALAAPFPGPTNASDPSLSDAERAYFALVDKWEIDEGAYRHVQRSKPQTLAVGLNDSPAGLATWIVEKWRSWSDSGGDVERRFSKDELLTNVSIYWFTQTIGSSVRMYYEYAHGDPKSATVIETPARLFLTREAVDICPPEFAARSYANLSYGLAPTGGHFLAAEEPALLAADIARYFRAFR